MFQAISSGMQPCYIHTPTAWQRLDSQNPQMLLLQHTRAVRGLLAAQRWAFTCLGLTPRQLGLGHICMALSTGLQMVWQGACFCSCKQH
jgi:hypothetical protein